MLTERGENRPGFHCHLHLGAGLAESDDDEVILRPPGISRRGNILAHVPDGPLSHARNGHRRKALWLCRDFTLRDWTDERQRGRDDLDEFSPKVSVQRADPDSAPMDVASKNHDRMWSRNDGPDEVLVLLEVRQFPVRELSLE